MQTVTKIRLARSAYTVVKAGRRIFGLGDRVVAVRGGIRWELNLQEGIDFAIYILGMFERSTVSTLRELVKPGYTVLDIGANIGSHTLHLADAVGPEGCVYAFEPTDYAFAKLLRNIDLNPSLASRIIAEQRMLTAKPAETVQTEIYSSWPLTSGPDLHKLHGGRLMTTGKAAPERLDDYVKRQSIQRIDVIKIDVDGHELQVLSGARESLSHFRPLIIAEIAPYAHREENSRFEDFIDFLKELNYRYREIGKRRLQPLDAAQWLRRYPGGEGTNIVLVPNEP